MSNLESYKTLNEEELHNLHRVVFESEYNPNRPDDYSNAGGFLAHWPTYSEEQREEFLKLAKESTDDTRCNHEDDIEYGKSIDITPTRRAVQILCSSCGSVGTQIEEQSTEDEEHWYSIGEMWHELHNYFSDKAIKERGYKGIGIQK